MGECNARAAFLGQNPPKKKGNVAWHRPPPCWSLGQAGQEKERQRGRGRVAEEARETDRRCAHFQRSQQKAATGTNKLCQSCQRAQGLPLLLPLCGMWHVAPDCKETNARAPVASVSQVAAAASGDTKGSCHNEATTSGSSGGDGDGGIQCQSVWQTLETAPHQATSMSTT